MAVSKRIVAAVPAAPVLGAAFVLGQVLKAAHRSDLPSFPNQEPSGTFGSPDLPPLRIVAVGDSSLTAPGVEKLDNCWIRRNARHFADRYHVELISLGVGGSKAHDVIEGQLHAAERLAPDIAVVSVGANDALRGVRPARFRQAIDEIVSRLEIVSKAIVVIGMGDISSVPRLPATLKPWVSHRSRLFNQISGEVAARHPLVTKVDTTGRMSTAFFEDESLFAGDLFHAGDGGHQVFAEESLGAFIEAMRIAGYEV